MKKLWKNKFFQLPVFLGLICLVFSTLLAVTYHFTAPIIKKNADKKEAESYANMYGDGITLGDEVTIKDNKYLVSYRSVTTKDQQKSNVYKCKSGKGYSGNITFLLGLDSESKVNAYSYIESTEDSKGNNVFSDNATILGYLKNYSASGIDFATSPTTPYTTDAIKEAVDAAIAFNVALGGSGETETNDLPEKEKAAILAMYGNDATYDYSQIYNYESGNLKYRLAVGTHTVYKAVTNKGYSGTITFLLGISSEGKVDGYRFLSGNEDSVGRSYFQNNDNILSQVTGYDNNTDVDLITDATTGNNEIPQITISKFKEVVDIIIADFNENVKGGN